jgi:hypothetical protein
MLNPREMSSADFAAMPALAADAQAALHLSTRADMRKPTDDATAERVQGLVRDILGISLVGPFNWLHLIGPNGTGALIIFHKYSAPAQAEAEVLIMSHRFYWSRATFVRLAHRMIDELGLRKIKARLPIEMADPKDLLQRAGFKFEGLETQGDKTFVVWSMLPGMLLTLGRAYIGASRHG